MDAGWISPGLAADFVEKGRTEHHSPRERGDVRNGLAEREDVDLDIIEAGTEKAFLDRIDRVVGVGGDRESRGSRRKEP
jgi:hypothetical protein